MLYIKVYISTCAWLNNNNIYSYKYLRKSLCDVCSYKFNRSLNSTIYYTTVLCSRLSSMRRAAMLLTKFSVYILYKRG